MSEKQQVMLDEMKVAIYRALDQEGDTEKRVSLALNAMAFASGIASAIMEEGGRGKISAASLLSAVLQSEIVSGGIDRYAKHGRPQ